MQNLREKLLKAGLINEDQATRAEKDKSARPPPPDRSPRPQQQRGGRPDRADRPERGERSRTAPIPKLPPLAVPNNKEFQRLEAKRQVELDRRIREMVQAAQLELPLEGQTFYFVTRKNKLRRMQISPEIAAKLEGGELAVVERPDPGSIEHAVVPAEVALQILELQPRSVRFFNRKDQPIGFLSDDDLSRRQKAESDSDPDERPIPTATDPDEAADVDAEPEKDSDTEAIARTAERTATHVPGGDPNTSDE